MNVVVVGGGIGGITCAIRIKQNNPLLQVTVIEQLDQVCKKIYATGNGRCNITNTKALDYNLTAEFLNTIGIVTRTDSEGRVYPYSNQASTVVDILVNTCVNLNVELILNSKILNAEIKNNKCYVYTDSKKIESDFLVLATGGMAQSSLGSDGSGYSLAKKLGHKITDLQPGLVMLKSPNKNCHALKGIRTKCNITIEENSVEIAKEYGELLFTEYGISGIVVMDLSKYISDEKIQSGKSRYTGIIDFIPEYSENQLIEYINKYDNLLGILPKKLCDILEKQTNKNKELMVKYAKNWRIIINGTRGYKYAQITCGGVSLQSLDKSNCSLISPNLYIIGELTDNQFNCGGFNINYAITSGIKAADSITKKATTNYD